MTNARKNKLSAPKYIYQYNNDITYIITMVSNINIHLNVFLYFFDIKAKKVSKIVMFVNVYNTTLEVKISLEFSGRITSLKTAMTRSLQTEVFVFRSLLFSLISRATAVHQLK